jgi:phosphatidate cytidylyltransferase
MGGLRELTVPQQVGLLFVTLLGVLTLVSLVALWRTLRAEDPQVQETQANFNRDLRAVWVAAALFWTAWAAGAMVSTLLFGIVSFVAFRELITLTHTRRADHRSLLLAFFVVLPIQYVLVAWQLFDLFTVFIPVYVFLAIPVVSAFGNDPQRFLERTAKIQWGIMVCVYGISHAPALLVLYLVAVVAIAQIAQESASRRLRRRPVARAISRSFSIRAWLVGAFSAALLGGLLYWATPFKPIPAFLMGFIAGGSGTLGEFVMKALKRDAGVRNWGGKASVTGAVGLLDRVAPLCFAAPVFFHAVRWYFGL